MFPYPTNCHLGLKPPKYCLLVDCLRCHLENPLLKWRKERILQLRWRLLRLDSSSIMVSCAVVLRDVVHNSRILLLYWRSWKIISGATEEHQALGSNSLCLGVLQDPSVEAGRGLQDLIWSPQFFIKLSAPSLLPVLNQWTVFCPLSRLLFLELMIAVYLVVVIAVFFGLNVILSS